MENRYLWRYMTTFADRVIHFNENIHLEVDLPEGIRVMNPFRENPHALKTSSAFYKKFYNDNHLRRLILGINPGRFGAGVTGVPFTDTKRLEEKCGLSIEGISTHEPSSVFVYEMIDAWGGVDKFYKDFYINSISPLGFVKINDRGREINYNYYDSKELTKLIWPFAIESVKAHIDVGCRTDVAFCLGTGKNFQYISKLNQEHGFFKKLIPLEHPRYIMQYKSKEKDFYLSKFMELLSTGI